MYMYIFSWSVVSVSKSGNWEEKTERASNHATGHVVSHSNTRWQFAISCIVFSLSETSGS